MTPADSRAFAQAFNRLSVAFPARFKDDDTQGSKFTAAQRVYWEAMIDLPIDGVIDGAAALVKTQTFFPSPAEWIAASKLAHRRAEWKALMPAPGAEAAAAREWKHECKTCEDSGFEIVECKPGHRCYRRLCKKADEADANRLADLERTAKAEGRELTEDELPKPYTHNYCIRCFCVNTNKTYQRQWKSQWQQYTCLTTLRGVKSGHEPVPSGVRTSEQE